MAEKFWNFHTTLWASESEQTLLTETAEKIHLSLSSPSCGLLQVRPESLLVSIERNEILAAEPTLLLGLGETGWIYFDICSQVIDPANTPTREITVRMAGSSPVDQ